MTRERASIVAVFVVAFISDLGCREPATVSQGQVPLTDLPCDVETVLATRCWACHGQTPMTLGVPSLTSVAAFMTPSKTDPSQSTGMLALTRMQSTTTPMPPPPAAAATTAELSTLSVWVMGGYPAGTGCGGPTCSSGKTWTGGNEGSPDMNPGMACNLCHGSDEGPSFSISGTLYPTIHEPALCHGANASTGAQVVVTGADGRTLTLAPNAAGNFFSEMAVVTPYTAKVVTSAGQRAMTAAQTSGDCNACHTMAGANGAPGRILLP